MEKNRKLSFLPSRCSEYELQRKEMEKSQKSEKKTSNPFEFSIAYK